MTDQEAYDIELTDEQREQIGDLAIRAVAAGLVIDLIKSFCVYRALGFSWADTLDQATKDFWCWVSLKEAANDPRH